MYTKDRNSLSLTRRVCVCVCFFWREEKVCLKNEVVSCVLRAQVYVRPHAKIVAGDIHLLVNEWENVFYWIVLATDHKIALQGTWPYAEERQRNVSGLLLDVLYKFVNHCDTKGNLSQDQKCHFPSYENGDEPRARIESQNLSRKAFVHPSLGVQRWRNAFTKGTHEKLLLKGLLIGCWASHKRRQSRADPGRVYNNRSQYRQPLALLPVSPICNMYVR